MFIMTKLVGKYMKKQIMETLFRLHQFMEL